MSRIFRPLLAQMGFEGANVIFDAWVHPLMMGLEEHLLAMFRDDAEFHDDAAPSHLGGKVDTALRADASPVARASDYVETQIPITGTPIIVSWADEAERELKKIPFSCAVRPAAIQSSSPASGA